MCLDLVGFHMFSHNWAWHCIVCFSIQFVLFRTSERVWIVRLRMVGRAFRSLVVLISFLLSGGASSERSSSGLLEWESVNDAMEALALMNHYQMKNPSECRTGAIFVMLVKLSNRWIWLLYCNYHSNYKSFVFPFPILDGPYPYTLKLCFSTAQHANWKTALGTSAAPPPRRHCPTFIVLHVCAVNIECLSIEWATVCAENQLGRTVQILFL